MSKIKLEMEEHKRVNKLHWCKEKSPECLGRFISSREWEGLENDMCVHCLRFLNLEKLYMVKKPIKNKRFWE